jgi:tyrosinase
MAAATTAGLPLPTRAAAGVRLEVTEFGEDSSLVKSLNYAVGQMLSNHDVTDPRSWLYWFYSHWVPRGVATPPQMDPVFRKCKHHMKYFYGWHRGYMYFFERMLQELSGNPNLYQPYWDYYRDPRVPQLYQSATLPDGSKNWLSYRRVNSEVKGLIVDSFSPAITTFPWVDDTAPTYESSSQINPHDQVHDTLGMPMSNPMTAPADPVFFAHHSNVDRLWSAWLHAGGGRSMPAAGDPYWNAAWSYNLSGSWHLTLAQMIDTTSLGYTFADLSLPTAAPQPIPTAAPLLQTQMALRPLSASLNVMGAVGGFALSDRSATVAIPIAPSRKPRLRQLLELQLPELKHVDIALEGVKLTERGEQGGYNYKVFLNLPTERIGASPYQRYYLGSFGSFGILADQEMHGGPVTLRFAATNVLRSQASNGTLDLSRAALSFIISGAPEAASPGEPLITVDRVVIVTAP